MSALKDDQKLVVRVDDHAHDLTDWEVNFVATCLKRVREGHVLTERQREIMERLDEEKVE